MVAPIVIGSIVAGTLLIGGGILGWNLKKTAPSSTVTGSLTQWVLDTFGIEVTTTEILLVAGGLLLFLWFMNRNNRNTAGVVVIN